MKNTFLSLILLLLFSTASYGQYRKYHEYEGTVGLTYSYIGDIGDIGLETIHGVRYQRSDFFLGGIAGFSTGEIGFLSYAGFFPRWYFGNGVRVEGFASCGVMYFHRNFENGAKEKLFQNHSGGLDLMPEIGLAIKFLNGDALDISLRWHNLFEIYNTSREYFLSQYQPVSAVEYAPYPGLSLSYWF